MGAVHAARYPRCRHCQHRGQLRTKTWPELAKWHALAVNKSWFTYTATSLFYSALPGHDRTWRVDAITWSENNTEAIAGLHNKGRRAFALFDEASSIAGGVWETIEGALTDAGTELFWLAFGNPTRTTGRFRECFAGGRFAHRWQPQQIDSRSVSMTHKAQIATWVHDYGEDSDFVRVRVKGEFPRAGTMQFDGERVQHAVERELFKDPAAALVMGVDIARQGEDKTVIRFRRGLDARSIPAVKFRIPDLMVTAGRAMELVNSYEPDAVFVDGTGIGWGVVDRLSQLGCSTVRGIDFGAGAERTDSSEAAVRYANKRAEMWGHMKHWCRFGCLPDDRSLVADFTAVDYGYDATDAIRLERKDDMRKRGLASPDDGDAGASRQIRGERGNSCSGQVLGCPAPTACVFHLMRAMEIAVRRLASRFNLPIGQNVTWVVLTGNMTDKINSWKKDTERQRLKRDAWSAAVSNLPCVGKVTRNPTMHQELHAPASQGSLRRHPNVYNRGCGAFGAAS